MTVIATALRHLMAAGVSGEDLIRAIAEIEEQLNAQAHDTARVGRSTGAQRQARYRQRRAASQSVTSDVCDVTNVTRYVTVTPEQEKEKSLTKKEKEPSVRKENPPTGVKRKETAPSAEQLNNFERLWIAWRPVEMPKGSKQTAWKKYLTALKETDHETIISAATRYCDECHRGGLKTRHLATWLHQRGWIDDPTVYAGEPRRSNGHDPKASLALALADTTRRPRDDFSEAYAGILDPPGHL